MNTITHSQLVELIKTTKGAAIVGIEALTDAKPLKTGNPFDGINKQVRAVGFVGVNYGESVKREGERQGADDAIHFEAGKLPWGKWLEPNKIIEHKGSYYLRTQSTPRQRQKQPARLLAYRDNAGKFLSPEDVKPFLKEATESAKQEAFGLTGTVSVKNYRFDSLLKVRINGKTFKVVKDS